MTNYYAGKSYVVLFSEALWHETRGKGVSVTVSCPGPVATEFGAQSGNEKSVLFTMGATAGPEKVAREAYRAMMKGRRLIVHGLLLQASMATQRLAPRGVVHGIANQTTLAIIERNEL
jgi:short-subunit dehydrogenase